MGDRAGVLNSYYKGEEDSWIDVHRLLLNEENVYWRSAYLRILGAMAPGTPESLQAALTSVNSKSPIERESALRIMANEKSQIGFIESGGIECCSGSILASFGRTLTVGLVGFSNLCICFAENIADKRHVFFVQFSITRG